MMSKVSRIDGNVDQADACTHRGGLDTGGDNRVNDAEFLGWSELDRAADESTPEVLIDQ